jgi:hypothetical protein
MKKQTEQYLRKLIKEELLKESDTEHFVVNSKTKKIMRATDNSRSYWTGDKQGTVDMEIEVFGYNQAKEAKLLYDALVKSGLQNRYFSVKVSVKSNKNEKPIY